MINTVIKQIERQQAGKEICEFYGIQITAPVAEKIKPSEKIVTLADLI